MEEEKLYREDDIVSLALEKLKYRPKVRSVIANAMNSANIAADVFTDGKTCVRFFVIESLKDFGINDPYVLADSFIPKAQKKMKDYILSQGVKEEAVRSFIRSRNIAILSNTGFKSESFGDFYGED